MNDREIGADQAADMADQAGSIGAQVCVGMAAWLLTIDSVEAHFRLRLGAIWRRKGALERVGIVRHHGVATPALARNHT